MEEQKQDFTPEENEAAKDSAQAEEHAEETGEEAQSEEANDDAHKVAVLAQELTNTKDQMMRALAEAENTRRRAQKDREEATKFAVSGFARDLLEVADNLARAIEAVPDDLKESEPRVQNLMEGIEATERNLMKIFEKNKIEKIAPAGETFDPNFHEVMFEAPGTGQPAGTIIEVIETGYVLNGRLLRPARVGVAKDEGQGNAQADAPNTDPGSQIDTEA